MKILIGITSCHSAVYPDAMERDAPPNNALCPDASRATWIRDAKAAGIDVKFFYGRGATHEPLSDEVFLDADDSYDGLIEKVTAMFRWALAQDYDFIMKVDVDSYVNIKNLLDSDFRDWDYTGRGWGLGYVLSKRAMGVVVEGSQRKLSWAEDSHVLRKLIVWGNKSSNNKIKLYGDGRYVFLPNLIDPEVGVYNTAFIVLNPMNPENMRKLHSTGSLRSIMPFNWSAEDLWTAPKERTSHGRLLGACAIYGCPCPISYSQWAGLTEYTRQPYLDWTTLVNACIEADKIDKCPSFETWMQPLENRKQILDWARKTNFEAEKFIEALRANNARLQRVKEEALVAVMTCSKYAQRARAQKENWIKAARRAGFNVEVFDGFRLGVSDTYVDLPAKTKALNALALRYGYKTLCKVDDDSHIFVPNFQVIEEDYAGIPMLWNNLGLPEAGIPPLSNNGPRFNYASGGCYWLGEKSMQLVADAPVSDWAEDRWVGKVLGLAGIQLMSAVNYYIVGQDNQPCEISLATAAQRTDVVALTQIYGVGH